MTHRFLIWLWLGLISTPLARAQTNDWFTNGPLTVLEERVLLVRGAGLSAAWLTQLAAFTPTNRLVGTVLDLRFAEGDLAAVAATRDFFAARKNPLVLLVNAQTRGAAAELAAQLRASQRGLLMGSSNSPAGLVPDIVVTLSAEEEKNYFANPYAAPIGRSPAAFAGTNGLVPFIDHMTEAELVRRRLKDGEEGSEETRADRPSPAQPIIHDPLLARAVDFLKALAILPTRRT